MHYVKQLNGQLTQYKRYDLKKDKSNKGRYSRKSNEEIQRDKETDKRLKALFNSFGCNLK